MKTQVLFLSLLLSFTQNCLAIDKPVIRLGILPFGTVNWELAAIDNEDLDDSAGFSLEIQRVATPQAGKIALQSGAVDIIVSDWIWVSRTRWDGFDFTFYPYSSTSGALLVPKDSPIRTLPDLDGKSLGIAGGELDKNWLLLQALAMKKYQLNLNQSVEKVYAAPPLLNQQILQGRVDAIMNYWHFAVRLETQDYRKILDGNQIIQELGIAATVPSLGYVFNQKWAEANRSALDQFLQATRKSKDLICDSDTVWEKIIPLTRTENKNTQNLLRQRYCNGRIRNWGTAELKAADQIYSLLSKYSNSRLTGSAKQIQPGTFWSLP